MRTIEEVIAERHQGDLISREALKKALEVTQYNDIDDLTRTERLIDNAQPVVNAYTKGFSDGERSGRNFPLTDEEKAIIVRQWRPHGEWITWEEAENYIASPNRHECSCCHDSAQILINGIELLSDYCPNCGADMRGE
jgi:hypothetical protein